MDTGIGSMIMLIVGLSVAAAAGGVIITISDELSIGLEDLSESETQSLRTDIEIISDTSADAIYDSGEVTLLIKNTGNTELNPEDIIVQIDGEFVNKDSVEVVNGQEWTPSNVVRVTVTNTLSTGDSHIFSTEIESNTDSITKVITNG